MVNIEFIGLSLIGFAVLLLLFQNILNINKKKSVKLFFVLFLICGVSSVFCGISFVFSQFLPENILSLMVMVGSLWSFAAFGLVLLHSSLVLGNKKTSVLFSILLLFGLFFELIGVKYGWIFGKYFYTGTPFFFDLVPLTVPFTWATFIYTAYSISNIFLIGFKGEKPSLPASNLLSYISMVFILSLICGLITVNLDMILDPNSVSPQVAGWVWVDKGSYFGVPVSNFLGWFFVAFLSTLLFRFYESFSLEPGFRGFSSIDFYVPVLYFMIFLILAAQAINIGHAEYVLIGVTTMFPFLLIVLLIFFNFRLGEG